MSDSENKYSTKAIIDLLLYRSNLVKTFGFFCTIVSLSFFVGFYFGKHDEESQHSIEINNLNFQHTKDLNEAVDKKREAHDKVYQQKIDDLQTRMQSLENSIHGKH